MRTEFDDRIPLGGRRERGRAKRVRRVGEAQPTYVGPPSKKFRELFSR